MRKNNWILTLCLLAGGFVGCSDDDGGGYDFEKIYAEERASIQKYLAKVEGNILKISVPFKSGRVDTLYVFNLKNQEGALEGKEGNWTLINYDYYGINRASQAEILITTTDLARAVGAGVTPVCASGGPVYFELDSESILSELTSRVKENGSGEMLIPSIFLGSSSVGISNVFKVQVKKIVTEKLLDYENKLIDSFLDTAHFVGEPIPVALKTGNDTIAQIAMLQVNPTGREVLETDSVKIQYYGEILDEINTPLRKIIDIPADKAIFESVKKLHTIGLQKTIVGLHVGEEAYLLFPSGMAYGAKGGYGGYPVQCLVPPYSTLVYKVKILDAKSK